MITFAISKSQHYYDLFVRRSQSCLFDVYWQCNMYKDPEFNTSVLHLYRCRKLFLRCNFFPYVYSIIGRLRAESAPHLESFKLDLQDSFHMEDEFSPPLSKDLFEGGAPVLSSVKLCGISPLGCNPPLNAVTSLELHTDNVGRQISLQKFAQVLLPAASSLKQLSLGAE